VKSKTKTFSSENTSSGTDLIVISTDQVFIGSGGRQDRLNLDDLEQRLSDLNQRVLAAVKAT